MDTAGHVEARLRRAEYVLTKVSEGDLDQRLDIGATEDALTGLEMGINFLVVDLRRNAETHREQRGALLAQQRELEAKLVTIEQQAAAIRELTTPVMEIWDDVLVLPIVGILDTQRSMEITEDLLVQIVARQARCVILDITGVEMVDTRTADHLLKVVRAAALLGSHCVLTGLSPTVAQTLVELGTDLGGVTTLRDLKSGLKHCLRILKAEES